MGHPRRTVLNLPLFALYVGPDQMMPLASVMASIVGVLLIFWNKLLTLFGKITARFRSGKADAASQSLK